MTNPDPPTDVMLRVWRYLSPMNSVTEIAMYRNSNRESLKPRIGQSPTHKRKASFFRSAGGPQTIESISQLIRPSVGDPVSPLTALIAAVEKLIMGEEDHRSNISACQWFQTSILGLASRLPRPRLPNRQGGPCIAYKYIAIK